MARLPEKPQPFAPSQQVSAAALNKMLDAIMRQFFGGPNVEVQHMGDRVRIGAKVEIPFRRDVTDFIVPFIVLEEFDDYLKCMPFIQPVNQNDPGKPWVPYILGNTSKFPIPGLEAITTVDVRDSIAIYVAKPFDLQKTPWLTTTAAGASHHAYNLPEQTVADVRDYWPTAGGTRKLVYTSRNRRQVRFIAPLSNWRSQEVDHQTVEPPYVRNGLIEARAGATGYYGPDGIPIAWSDVNVGGRGWRTEHHQQYAQLVPWTSGADDTFGNQDSYRKVISLSGGGQVRAYSSSVVTPGETSTGFTSVTPDAGFPGPESFTWLVPITHGHTVYLGRQYLCWKGPLTADGHQLFYTEGEPKTIYVEGAGVNWKLVVPKQVSGSYVEDTDWKFTAGGSFLGVANPSSNSFDVRLPYTRDTFPLTVNPPAGFYKARFNHLGAIVVDTVNTEYVEPPVSPGSLGEPGQRSYDATYIYQCIAVNTWKRLSWALAGDW